jgi:diguanylate cyclase (GGDEF)-like protein
MNNETVTLNARRVELLKAFLNQVPERINAILENWHHLVQGDWSPESFKSLQERLHTLTVASAKFQVSQIQSSGLSLLNHLNDFSDSDHKPRHDDLVKLDGLIHAFGDAALEACRNEPRQASAVAESPVALARQGRVYLFGLDEASVPGLRQALQQKQLEVESTTDLQPVIARAETQDEALAVIAPVDRLKELFPDSPEAGLWQADGGLPGVPVAFLATDNDLQLRLAAMRTQAKAYWSQPIDPEQVASRMHELMSPQSHTPYRILIVEDDPAQADFASAILRKAHFECLSVTEPLQVMEVLSRFRPDLILMDLYMPEANGCELTTVIREQPEFVGVPVVFLSGEQDRDKQLNALSCGGEDFLSKPIGPKHLIKTVTNRIRRAQQLNKRLSLFSPADQAQRAATRELLLDRVDALLKTRPAGDPQHAVLYLDIDQADEITQKIGIGGMDVLLSEIGKQLRRIIRPQDSLGRFGDHSLGMVVNCNCVEALEAFAAKLRDKIADHPVEVEGQIHKVRFSIGACFIDNTVQDATSLFSRAKFAGRMAQKAGGNQLHVQLPEQHSSTGSSNDSMVNLILKAIKHHYLEIYFQPIVALKGNSDEAHYQALIRLQEPDGKLHTAAEFIPTAERIGVIAKIDHWTTRTALTIINQQKQQGNPLHLFVSQAADLLDNMERLSWLKEKHRRGLIGAGDLTFEFRLLDILKHQDSAKVCFDMLHSVQVMTLLTGFDDSPEAQELVKNLTLDYVKLDTKLLQDPGKDLKELITAFHVQKIKVIAPQVEDPRSIALLWSSGVDFVQGNFVQRPENNLIYDFNESVLN